MFSEIKDKNELLTKLKTLRETKGAEDDALALIEHGKSIAEFTKDYDFFVTLLWEESLVWQHVVMTGVNDASNNADVSMAKENMAIAAIKAYELVKKHGLTRKEALALRFLGRVSDYADDYKKACAYYLDALKLLSHDSYSRLEIEGFLATSTIMLGEVESGLNMAKKVYDEFETYELGKSLKTSDFYTWAVWRSGITYRVANSLVKLGVTFDKNAILDWVNASIAELETPNKDVSWGDNKFEFRINELNSVLSKITVFLFTFISSFTIK